MTSGIRRLYQRNHDKQNPINKRFLVAVNILMGITLIIIFILIIWPLLVESQEKQVPSPTCEQSFTAVVEEWKQCIDLKAQTRVICERDKGLLQAELTKKDAMITDLTAKIADLEIKTK